MYIYNLVDQDPTSLPPLKNSVSKCLSSNRQPLGGISAIPRSVVKIV